MFRQALWLAIMLGVALLLAVRYGGPLLLDAFGIDPEIVGDTGNFLRAIAWGAPALTMYFALRGLSEGLALTRPTMYFGLFGLVLLAPIGYVLMYGRFGFAARGAQGSGIATATVLWLQFGAFALYLHRRDKYRDIGPFSRFERPHWGEIAALLRLGVPMGVAVLMECALFVCTALLIASLGAVTVASHQVAINVASVTFMLPLGLAMATTVRVGQAAGRGDAEGVRRAGLAGIGLSLVTQVVSASAMALFPIAIARAYTDDAGVVALAAQLLVLAAIFQFSDGIQVTANGALARNQGYDRADADHARCLLADRHAGRLLARVPPALRRTRHVDGSRRRPHDGRRPAAAAVPQGEPARIAAGGMTSDACRRTANRVPCVQVSLFLSARFGRRL